MKIAVVFSGQGAQKPGMGKDFYDNNIAAKAVFDKFDDSVLDDCFTADEARLALTSVTQPCIYAVSMAGFTALEQALTKTSYVISGFAGFSLGEYAGLTASGILNLEECYKLVKIRGGLMQSANDKGDCKGAMAAIIGDDTARTELLEKTQSSINSNIWEVNFNCPKQVVVAGDELCINYAVENGKELGLKVVKLAVSGAFHSPFMQPVGTELGNLLNTMQITQPKKPLYANVTAKPLTDNFIDTITRQVCSPVLWQQTILYMIADGYDTFVEVGIGNTLCGLIRKIDKTVTTTAVNDCASLEKSISLITGQ